VKMGHLDPSRPCLVSLVNLGQFRSSKVSLDILYYSNLYSLSFNPSLTGHSSLAMEHFSCRIWDTILYLTKN